MFKYDDIMVPRGFFFITAKKSLFVSFLIHSLFAFYVMVVRLHLNLSKPKSALCFPVTTTTKKWKVPFFYNGSVACV